MTDEDRSRRRAAKLSNERLKLIAALCNTAGVATFITLVVVPAANDRATTAGRVTLAMLLAFVLHGAGQLVLNLWRSED